MGHAYPTEITDYAHQLRIIDEIIVKSVKSSRFYGV